MLKLKTLFRASAILIPAITLNSIGYAFEDHYNIDAYAGSEANIRRMPFKRHFGSSVFNGSFYNELNVFAGFNVNRYFGLEAGYEFSDIKTKSKRGKNGSYLFGARLIDSDTGFDSITNFVMAKSRISGFNINLMAYIPINNEKNISLIGSVGLGHLRSDISCDVFEVGEKNIAIDEMNVIVQRFSSTKSRYKKNVITTRLSTGIQYVISNNFGIRALAGWENTHKIMIQGKDRDTGKKVNEYSKFKNSVTYRIGFFIPF